MPAVLFIVEADKSPIWLNILNNTVIKLIYKYETLKFPNLFINIVYIIEIIIAPIVPPNTSFY